MSPRPTEVTYPANLSLENLNSALGTDELSIGPLIKLATDGALTVATFDARGVRVTQPCRLILKVGATAVVPQGSVNVAEGTVFITSQKADVVAVRP